MRAMLIIARGSQGASFAVPAGHPFALAGFPLVFEGHPFALEGYRPLIGHDVQLPIIKPV